MATATKAKSAEAEVSRVANEVRKQMDLLRQLRETAAKNMERSIQASKDAERQAFILRGKIAAYDEQMADLQKRHGVEG